MLTNENIYNIALSFLPGIGDINAKKMLAHFGSAENIFKSDLAEFCKIPSISEIAAKRIYSFLDTALENANIELEYVYSNELDYTVFTDASYPVRLKECDDAPIVLYHKGAPNFNAKKIISIVGTRNATQYGKDFCESIISEIASKYPDTIIVSGLAFGIDVAAHKAAIKYGLETWAILGHSLKTIYPAVHKKVAHDMINEGGAIISDYSHVSKIDPGNFIRRNRIIAGLADVLIVVESGQKGGSMSTANIANHYNRDVFALPGNISSTYSKGCNNLIKTNRAHLIASLADVEYIMGWLSKEKNKSK